VVERNDLKSLQVEKRYKSMPNMALQSHSVGEALEIGWSPVETTELNVKSSKSAFMTPGTAEVNEVEMMLLFVLSILPSVRPIESDALQLRSDTEHRSIL